MIRRRPNRSRYAAVLGLGVLVALGSARSVRAQGHTPDPFNGVGEGNLDYLNYVLPTYPIGYGVLPNQNLLSGRTGVSRANQFQSYLESIDGLERGPAEHDVSAARRAAAGVPYYRANRSLDPLANRIALPADTDYLRDRQERDQKYFAYLREKDPTKRAQIYREFIEANQRAERDLVAPRVGGTPRAATASRTAVPPLAPASRGTPSTATARPVSPTIPSPSPNTRRSIVPAPGSYATNPSLRRSPAPLSPSNRSAGSAPPTPTTGTTLPSGSRTPTPSEILQRSERRDRANRATSSPTAPNR